MSGSKRSHAGSVRWRERSSLTWWWVGYPAGRGTAMGVGGNCLLGQLAGHHLFYNRDLAQTKALARRGFSLHPCLLRHTHWLHAHFSRLLLEWWEHGHISQVLLWATLQLVLCPIAVPSTLMFVLSGQPVASGCFLMVVKRIIARDGNSWYLTHRDAFWDK